jgi:hypothetical protein
MDVTLKFLCTTILPTYGIKLSESHVKTFKSAKLNQRDERTVGWLSPFIFTELDRTIVETFVWDNSPQNCQLHEAGEV